VRQLCHFHIVIYKHHLRAFEETELRKIQILHYAKSNRRTEIDIFP